MVKHEMEGDFVASNGMVKEEVIHNLCLVVECWHGFIPFGEVVNEDYDVFMPIVGWRVASHEINTPFSKGACLDDCMKRSMWYSIFICIKLTFVTIIDAMNAFIKQRGPKVTNSNHFLCSGHVEEVTSTCASVTVI